ncbi:MAG: hypothetical protein U0176_10840 [Bacteroidia bacterium]
MVDEKDPDDINRLQERWSILAKLIEQRFGKKPDLEAMLFLIGVRELGAMPDDFTKEQKVDLMHVGLCAVLAQGGYFQLSHQDQDGWPHWDQLQPLPYIDIFSQEVFLKSYIVDYFAGIYEI